MEYKLATTSWDQKEIDAACDVIKSGNCSMGKLTKQFENEFAKKIGMNYSILCNSGSSANLLAISSFLYRKNGLSLKAGDVVICPAVSWTTTFTVVTNIGCEIRFVDINKEDFNISIEEVEKAICPRTKAIMAVNLLGTPCNIEMLRHICNKNNLILILDNCESLGSTVTCRNTETYADVATTSFFFSHHLNGIEAGAISTNDLHLAEIMWSIRNHGWIRNLPDKNTICNKSGNYFEDTFKFVLPGYNLRPTDVSAAILLKQLEKYDDIMMWRRKNAYYLESKLKVNPNLSSFKLQHVREEDVYNPSWFGFGFITTQHDRMKVIEHLTKYNIESRPIVTGNYTKNICIDWMSHTIQGDLPNANIIDKQGFFIGNNGVDMTPQIDYFIDVLKKLE